MTEVKKKQTMRFSEQELGLIKNTFGENDELARVIRKFFLQGDLSVPERATLSLATNPTILFLLRKSILPTLDFDSPLFQMVDMFTNVNTKEQSVSNVAAEVAIKELGVEYLESMFGVLEGSKKKSTISFEKLGKTKGKEISKMFTDLGARNFILSHVQMNLQTLLLLGGAKTETVEETTARLAKNSAK